ncbi:acetamidase/formamidase family protein [Micromonospora costi]|uniref:acetamidase/formamidase family protein n=1 Tax=Micromonospora costi TaxID=1530042 RepID=UPI003F4CE4AC
MAEIVFRPARDEFAYTFGGRMPVAHVRSGDLLQVVTEDCFGGLVRGPADLPSQVCRMPYLNPVSGPFFVEDAEPGDTLAVHLISIEPSRDWGVSATFRRVRAGRRVRRVSRIRGWRVTGADICDAEASRS